MLRWDRVPERATRGGDRRQQNEKAESHLKGVGDDRMKKVADTEGECDGRQAKVSNLEG